MTRPEDLDAALAHISAAIRRLPFAGSSRGAEARKELVAAQTLLLRLKAAERGLPIVFGEDEKRVKRRHEAKKPRPPLDMSDDRFNLYS